MTSEKDAADREAAIEEGGQRDVTILFSRINSVIGYREDFVNCDWFKPIVIGCDELKYIILISAY